METVASVKKQLSDTYKYRIEMHAHTKGVSHCGRKTPTEQVEIYHSLGFDAIVISNHFLNYVDQNGNDYLKGDGKGEKITHFLSGFEEAKKRGDELGITVLLAAELRFDDSPNDYLLYGVDREVLEKCYDYIPLGLKKMRDECPLEKSVLIWAHPKRDGMAECPVELLDGIEIFNMHPAHNSRIGIATRKAYAEGAKIKTCGSDCHNDIEGVEGVSALRTKILPRDSFELAEILRSGEYLFEIGGGTLVLP